MEGKKKVVPLQSRLKRGSLRQESRGIEKPKKLQKSFAESKKVSTFATPIEKGVWKSGPEGSKYRKRSLKRLKESTRKQVPKQNERERQFLLGNESSGQAEKYKKYTKKSLILAQDER